MKKESQTSQYSLSMQSFACKNYQQQLIIRSKIPIWSSRQKSQSHTKKFPIKNVSSFRIAILIFCVLQLQLIRNAIFFVCCVQSLHTGSLFGHVVIKIIVKKRFFSIRFFSFKLSAINSNGFCDNRKLINNV